jgi:flavodoxin
MYDELMTDAVRKRVNAAVAEDPNVLPSTLAEEIGVAEGVVAACLPVDMCVAASADAFEDVCLKSLVVYSSKTGNTRKVAEAIYDILPDGREKFPVEEAPPADGYDFVAVGFWVDKGAPDQKATAYMKTLSGSTVGLFGTLGAKPDSDHARECVRKAVDLVDGNRVMGSFLCQGRIDPAVVEMMKQHASDIHPMTAERMANIQAAESHPDETDLANARTAFEQMVRELQERGNR